MKDQHEKIKGYRDLTQLEIDLMNEVKAHGEKTRELLEKLDGRRQSQLAQSLNNDAPGLSMEQIEESLRCIDNATTALQTGQMWFVRAIALPDSF